MKDETNLSHKQTRIYLRKERNKILSILQSFTKLKVSISVGTVVVAFT